MHPPSLSHPRQSPHRHILQYVAACVALCAALLSFGPRHAVLATDSGGGLAVSPVSSDPKAGVTNRPTFDYRLDPGAIQNDAVVVSNLNSAPQRVTVYVANAFTTSGGLIGVRANEHSKTGPVEWMHFTTQLADNTFDLPALTSKTIPFQITIPANAPPGDYAFGIAVAPDAKAAPVPGQNTVQILQAAASLVEMRINGPLIPIIRIGSLRVFSEAKLIPGLIGGSTAVTFDVVNVGNQKVDTVIGITERNAFSGIIHTEPEIKLSNVIPGSRVTLTRSWDNDPYVKGSVRVQINTGTASSASRSINFWSVSWKTFVAPTVLIIVFFLIRWRLRRHRRERDARDLAELKLTNGSRRPGKRAPEPAQP